MTKKTPPWPGNRRPLKYKGETGALRMKRDGQKLRDAFPELFKQIDEERKARLQKQEPPPEELAEVVPFRPSRESDE